MDDGLDLEDVGQPVADQIEHRLAVHGGRSTWVSAGTEVHSWVALRVGRMVAADDIARL